MMSSTNKLSVPQSITHIGQIDNLLTGSKPDPIETLGVGSQTLKAHNVSKKILMNSKAKYKISFFIIFI